MGRDRRQPERTVARCARSWPGRALVAGLGLAALVSLLIVGPASATSPNLIHRYFHINAYGRQGWAECSNYWQADFGFCKGPGERGPDAEPFGGNGPDATNDYYVEFAWATPAVASSSSVFRNDLCPNMGPMPAGYYRKVLLWGIYPSEHSYLCGWADWTWGALDITSGLFYVRADRTWYTVARTQNLSVAGRGQPTGPLSLNLSYHSGDGPWGYSLQIDGYLQQNRCDTQCLALMPRDR